MYDFDKKYLEKLQLTYSDLQDLTEEEQRNKIRKSYYRLASLHHPDRSGNIALFKEIEEAYRTITSYFEDKYTPEIAHYFHPIPIELPDTAFDLLLEESIIKTYQDLLCTFSLLPAHEKQSFAQRYKQFINLAQTLEKKQTHLMQKRQAIYREQLLDESFWQAYQREWRKLIITLFGEEYLDDFQYRHAIATGEIGSVLAWRKLFSPIKAILVLVHSICLALVVLNKHIVHRVYTPLFFEVIQSAKNFAQGCADTKALALCGLKVVGFCIIVSVLPTTAVFILFMPHFISNWLYLIACPINKIIRPVAQYTSLSPYLIGTALLGLVGALGFFIINFFPILSGFISLFTVDNLSLVLMISCCIYDFIRPDDSAANVIETLPLPEENVPEQIRETVLREIKIGHHSAQFFNTPKDAPYLTKEDRTFWQLMDSFFGGGKKTFLAKEVQKESFIPQPLLIEGPLPS